MFTDLRLAWRQLAKTPAFALVAVLTFAVGISASTAIYSVIQGVLLRPLPWSDPEQLVVLWEAKSQAGADRELITPGQLEILRAQTHLFQDVAFWPAWPGAFDFKLVTEAGVEAMQGAFVSSRLFPLLGMHPLMGRGFREEEEDREGPPTVVLSYGCWQQRFGGDPAILGRTVQIDTFRRQAYEVVGVMRPGAGFPADAEVWLPTGWMGVTLTPGGTSHWLQVIARLRSGVTLDRARTEANARLRHANLPGAPQVWIVPLLEQTIGPTMRRSLVVLAAAVGCVLLIACANVANLLLARGAGRRREIGVRFALGASRWRVLRQLLAESLLLATAGGALGALVAWWSVDLFVNLNAGQLPRVDGITVDGWALGFAVGISLATGLATGVAPALQLWRVDLNDILKQGSGTVAATHNRLRHALVIGEIALTVVLLGGAFLMLKSLTRLERSHPGFDPEQLFLAPVDLTGTTDAEADVFRHLLERVRAYPGIVAAGAASRFPIADPARQFFTTVVAGADADSGKITSDWFGCTPEYFATMRIPLRQGRGFSAADGANSAKVALINETMARHLGHAEPVGQRITFTRADGQIDPGWREIIGVVGDTKNSGLEADVLPEVYVPDRQWSWSQAMLLVRTSSEEAPFASALRNDVQNLTRNVPLPKVVPLSDVMAKWKAAPRFRTTLLVAFGGGALLLMLFGIYALLSYTVAQRGHEIGIRMALGAQVGDVLRLVVGQGLKLAVLGLALGLAGAAALSRAIASLLYSADDGDFTVYVVVPVVIIAVVILASWGPARRAAKVSPLVALKAR